MSKIYTYEDLSEHKSSDSLWMVIRGKVYDITKFVDDHPGGEEVLYELGGLDATEPYDDIGHSNSADKMLEDYLIGTIDENSKPIIETKTVSATAQESGGLRMLPIFVVILIAVVAYLFRTYM